jgi:protein-S-isoprenylcysteine O-methyltransferase Ste14
MRLFILFYGLVSYFIGVIGLACIIAALAGLLPFGFLSGEREIGLNPVLWNFILVGAWGFIHSVTARPSFKKALTRFIPEPAERSTYVLISGVTSAALIGFWQNVEGQVWHFDNGSISFALWGAFWFGWAFLLASTFAINHFDLFGLRQVFLNFRNQERAPLKFTERLMYRHIRHPIQTGVLIGVWCTPSMSVTHLILSIGFTAYIVIGLWFEERDLVAEHGDGYRDYRKRAGAVLPRFGARS